MISEGFWSEWRGSNSRPRGPKPRVLSAELHPDIQFLPLYHGEGDNQRFFCLWSFMWSKPLLRRFRQSKKTPQTQASQGFAAFHLTLSRIPPRHSQSRRATNCATPRYSIKPHYIIAFWGGFVKHFSLWSKLWVGFKNVQILEKQKHADPCAAGICAAKPYYYTAWAARLQGLFAVRGALFCVLGARTLHGLMLL